jgi:hypothetical protein
MCRFTRYRAASQCCIKLISNESSLICVFLITPDGCPYHTGFLLAISPLRISLLLLVSTWSYPSAAWVRRVNGNLLEKGEVCSCGDAAIATRNEPLSYKRRVVSCSSWRAGTRPRSRHIL